MAGTEPFRQVVEHAEYRERVTADHALRQLERWGIPVAGRCVVDLGCGDGGGTLALAAAGAKCHGVDVDAAAVAVATQRAGQRADPPTFEIGNLTEPPPPAWRGQADLVLLQEVIEHVGDITQTLRAVTEWLKLGGQCMVTFPPYYSPVGGHHHYARVPYRFIPWLHLMVPQRVLLACLPSDTRYRDEVRTLNRITIARFEAAAAMTGWRVLHRVAYLIRPSISAKLSVPTLPAGWLIRVPGLRDFLVTGVEYLLSR